MKGGKGEMKKRKIVMSAIAGGLAALMLAGCNGGTDGGSTQDVTKLEGHWRLPIL